MFIMQLIELQLRFIKLYDQTSCKEQFDHNYANKIKVALHTIRFILSRCVLIECLNSPRCIS